MTDDEIVYLIHAHYATSGEIFDVIIFARAIEHCTLTKQKARWYQEGLEAGNTQSQELYGETEQLEAEIKRLQEREWVELTDEELNEHARWADEHGGTFYIAYARSIEAKLKEKNT